MSDKTRTDLENALAAHVADECDADLLRCGFEDGAKWALAQPPTDAEIKAAADVIRLHSGREFVPVGRNLDSRTGRKMPRVSLPAPFPANSFTLERTSH